MVEMEDDDDDDNKDIREILVLEDEEIIPTTTTPSSEIPLSEGIKLEELVLVINDIDDDGDDDIFSTVMPKCEITTIEMEEDQEP
mmetsp:Transcript_8211/g.9448  ORF Transcript_8211/g.9448 Transcript_8211/m.9448 type:complete len:85 (-) Transcript_8211:32-286(-)